MAIVAQEMTILDFFPARRFERLAVARLGRLCSPMVSAVTSVLFQNQSGRGQYRTGGSVKSSRV